MKRSRTEKVRLTLDIIFFIIIIMNLYYMKIYIERRVIWIGDEGIRREHCSKIGTNNWTCKPETIDMLNTITLPTVINRTTGKEIKQGMGIPLTGDVIIWD